MKTRQELAEELLVISERESAEGNEIVGGILRGLSEAIQVGEEAILLSYIVEGITQARSAGFSMN